MSNLQQNCYMVQCNNGEKLVMTAKNGFTLNACMRQLPVYMTLNNISWHCTSCGMVNFASNLSDSNIMETNNSFLGFDSSNISDTSMYPPGPPTSCSSPSQPPKSKKTSRYPLKTIVKNFQSIKNETEEVMNLIE